MNYRELDALARRADRARSKGRRRLVDRLAKELAKLDPFKGFNEETIWLAEFLARVKWIEAADLA